MSRNKPAFLKSLVFLFLALHGNQQVFAKQQGTILRGSKTSASADDLVKEIETIESKLPIFLDQSSSCDFKVESVSAKEKLLNQIDAELSYNSDVYGYATAQSSENTSTLKDVLQRSQQANRDLLKYAQNAELCIFKTKLDADIHKIGNEPQYKKFQENLRKASDCLATGFGRDNHKTKKGILGIFEDIFDFFWNKKDKLTDQDCEILKSTYSVWSSYYDDENQKLREDQTAGKIPLYNVNDHNSAFYYWSLEQNKGRVPKKGLTIFHADTHTDMMHVHDHTENHWSSDVLSLRDIQKVTNQNDESFKAAFIQKVNSNKSLDPQIKIERINRINDTSVAQLREELDQVVRKSVNHIAQPLAAAQLTGVNNGRFIMCMPPWSDELPRTTKNNPIEARFQKTYGSYSFVVNRKTYEKLKAYNDGINVNFGIQEYEKTEPAFAQDPDAVSKNSQFHVIDCNNEERKVINPSSPENEKKYTTQQREKPLPKITDFFSTEEEKNGFLLDIDLDAFVSEGHGGQVEPISYERPHSRGKNTEYAEHGSHNNSSETDTKIEVPSVEYDLIKSRIDSFFNRLGDLKAAGVSPKMITISDSTALKRAMRSQKTGEAVGSWEAYTPDCLVFLVNFMTRKKLQEIYPEVSSP